MYSAYKYLSNSQSHRDEFWAGDQKVKVSLCDVQLCLMQLLFSVDIH